MHFDVKDFLEPRERAAKEDDNSITIQHWNCKSNRFVAVVTALKEPNIDLDVDLTYRS